MAETIHSHMQLATVASIWRRSPELVRNRVRPTLEVIGSGSKIFRMNPVLFSLWLLFPLFLILTSDWIGVMVVFQAITTAVRLQKAPAAKTLAVCSSRSRSANSVKGEYRVL